MGSLPVKTERKCSAAPPRLRSVAGVEGRLAAAGLAAGIDRVDPEMLQQAQRRLAHFRVEGIHHTGTEQLDAHVVCHPLS